MRYHHTKNKGDLGAIRVMADMTEKGYSVLVPLTAHAAFDFVGYKDDRFVRVQAKYRAAINGTVVVAFKTNWSDQHGVHSKRICRTSIDLIGIYCPDTLATYYVDPATWPKDHITLRITEPRSGQRKRIDWAKDHIEIPLAVRGVPGGFGMPLVIAAGARHSSEPRAVWLS